LNVGSVLFLLFLSPACDRVLTFALCQLRDIIFQLATCQGLGFHAAWYTVAMYISLPASGTILSHVAYVVAFWQVDGPARSVNCHRTPATTCEEADRTCTNCTDMMELLCASITLQTCSAAASTPASHTPLSIGAPGMDTSLSAGPSTHTPSGSGAPICRITKLADGCSTAAHGFWQVSPIRQDPLSPQKPPQIWPSGRSVSVFEALPGGHWIKTPLLLTSRTVRPISTIT